MKTETFRQNPTADCRASTRGGAFAIRAWSPRLLVIAGAIAAASTGVIQAQPTGVQVPVIINIYPNSGTTEAQARDIIKESNKILSQAGYKLVPVKVNVIGKDSGGKDKNGGDDSSGGGTAGDGKFTRDERDAARTFGGEELRGLPNKRGIKISFGDTPIVGTTTPGVAIHNNPTVIVKNRPGATAAQSGIVTAHEVAHVLTLPDHTTAADNLMTPVEPPGGNTKLTAAQIAEMQKVKYQFGKCATQFKKAFPAIKDAEQFGGASDARGDQKSPAYLDLDQVALFSLDAAADKTGGAVSNIHTIFSVNGLLPASGSINASYAIAVNSDASNATGVNYAGLTGVDRIAYVTASGDMSLGTFALSGEVLDTTTHALTALPSTPLLETESEIGYSTDPATPSEESFKLDIPKTLFDLTSPLAPMVAVSGDMGLASDYADDVISDTAAFDFDSLRYAEDPTLTTFGTGIPTTGQPYQIAVSGLKPDDPFNLFLDDTVVLSGTLDSSGGFTGSFNFPTDMSTDQMHFLTAQDSTGEFAYNITCPMPESGTWIVSLACLLPPVGCVRRRRHVVSCD
jgi:hypothetical protein